MSSKIPQNNKQILVTNGKESFQGTIAYTKNIDLDEDGYIKLSPPMVKIYSNETSEGGDVDLDLPLDIFSYDDGAYKVITNDRAFNFSLTALDFTEDTGLTSWLNTSRVINWNNGNWFVNATNIYEYDGTNGNATYTSRISGELQYPELFTNKNTLVASNGSNLLKQYNTSYANTTDLTIPANFKISGTAYSNNFMGVITRQSKNQGNAYFFTWDGSTTSANAGYPVNDSFLTTIASYASSWVVMTSSGELLYFNGGGFESLGALPGFYTANDYISLGSGNFITMGKNIDVDGYGIYVNSPSLPEYSQNKKPYKPHVSGGVYFYDRKNGLYHRYSPSYSRYSENTGASLSNVITLSTHFLETGDEIWVDESSLVATSRTIYYAIKVSDTEIKLASSYDNAIAETNITLTDGNIGLYYAERKDFGVDSIRIQDLGLVKKARDYTGFLDTGILPTFMGASIRPNDLTGPRKNVLCALAPQISNRGYVVTGKFQTDSYEDTWQKIGVKYKKLSPQSSIIVKVKTKDEEPLIIGDETLYNDNYTGESVTWDSSRKNFVTSVDISDYEEGDEVYVFDGAGAGQSAHITNITADGAVTLDEIIRGVTNGAKSCVMLSKYKKLGTIDADCTEGVKHFPLNSTSPSVEVKLELRGIGVTISEILVINKSHKPSV